MLLCDFFFVTIQCLYKILFTSWCLGSEWRSQQVMGKWFSMWIRPCLNIFHSPEKWNGNSPHCGLRTRPVRVFGYLVSYNGMPISKLHIPHNHKAPPAEGHTLLPAPIQGLRNMCATTAPVWQLQRTSLITGKGYDICSRQWILSVLH